MKRCFACVALRDGLIPELCGLCGLKARSTLLYWGAIAISIVPAFVVTTYEWLRDRHQDRIILKTLQAYKDRSK